MSDVIDSLRSLTCDRIKLVPASLSLHRLSVGQAFRTVIRIDNENAKPIEWSSDRRLTLACRWFDAQGRIGVGEGERSELPMPIGPGYSLDVELASQAPALAGEYQLLISLVLEGVHWASDVSEGGHVTVPVTVIPPAQWPGGLNNSLGARALRGALAADALARALEVRPLDIAARDLDNSVAIPKVSAGSEPVRRTERSSIPKRSSLPRRMRAWLRHLLGIVEMRHAVEVLLQRSAEQHGQLLHLTAVSSEVEILRAELRQLRASFTRFESIPEQFATQAEATAMEFSKLAKGIEQSLEALGGAVQIEMQQRQRQDGSHAESVRAIDSELKSIAKAMTQTAERLVREFNEGGLSVTLLGGLRRIEDASAPLSIIPQIHERVVAVPELLTEIAARSNQDLRQQFATSPHIATLERLQFYAGAASAKLDSLLTRETIPVNGAGMVLARNPYGFLAIQHDDVAAIAYYSSGALPEAGTVTLVEQLLKPGDVMLDVGANIGAYCLIAARKVGNTGKVIAVEPVPETLRMLRTTVAINGLAEIVEVHDCALGAKAGAATIHSGSTSGHSSLLAIHGDRYPSYEVKVMRGSDLLRGRKPALIKIDVEGWELEVIKGLRSSLQESRAIALIVEFSPWHISRAGGDAAVFVEELRALGRRIWTIEDDPPALRPLVTQRDLGSGTVNLFVAARLPARLRRLENPA